MASVTRLLSLPRRSKQLLAMLTDAALCVLTVWLAICLRFESWVELQDWQWLPVIISPILAIPIFIRLGLYRAIFRYAGRQTILAIVRALSIYTLLFAALFTAISFPLVPRTIGIIQPVLLLVGISAVRLIAQHWLLSYEPSSSTSDFPRENVLIYGAGTIGQQLAASLPSYTRFEALGFIDKDKRLAGGQILGLTVYPPSQLAMICQERHIQHVLLAMPDITRPQRNEILQQLSPLGVAIRTLPSIGELVNPNRTVDARQLRELDVEDLLGRDPVPPIRELLQQNIKGKSVLVTGGGGSIGSELVRQSFKNGAASIIIFESSEFALYSILEELEALQRTSKQANCRLIGVLGSVCVEEDVKACLETYKPHTVFHAAAYKHVPLVESNALAATRNNIKGTQLLCRLAAQSDVQSLTLISSDKAVRPTNIMGATKRIAELCVQLAQQNAVNQGSHIRYSIVRFGNVLGSSGSVVPKFREQINAGGPITLTHPDITRYFMTIAEAAQLVIQANAMSHHSTGLRTDTYLLEMGQPVRIADLARIMIQLSGQHVRTNKDSLNGISIEYIGLRPGEKLYEELLVDGKSIDTAHPKIKKDNSTTDLLRLDSVRDALEQLTALPIQQSKDLIDLLVELVPDFQHQPTHGRPPRLEQATTV